METEGKKYVQLKYALTFSKLLDENKLQWKKNKEKGVKELSLVHNISQLSVETGLRTATLSSIFNGDSNPSGITIIQILDKLNKSFEQFGKCYDDLTNSEIDAFEYMISVKKNEKKNSKHSK